MYLSYLNWINNIQDESKLINSRFKKSSEIIIKNCKIEKWFVEPGFSDNCETDPYGESSPENIFKHWEDYANNINSWEKEAVA